MAKKRKRKTENEDAEAQAEIRLQLNQFQLIVLKMIAFLVDHDIAEEEIMSFLLELEFEHHNLIDKFKATEEQANVDVKTSLLIYKPDYLKTVVQTAARFKEASRKSRKFAISYFRIDIDDFSILNNRWGHEFGDEVLIAVAKTIKAVVRDTDYPIRFGGEEFDLILPNTDAAGSKVLVRKLLKKIRALKFEQEDNFVDVRVSIGMSTVLIDLDDFIDNLSQKKTTWSAIEEIVKQADDACYHAKKLGKRSILRLRPRQRLSRDSQSVQ